MINYSTVESVIVVILMDFGARHFVVPCRCLKDLCWIRALTLEEHFLWEKKERDKSLRLEKGVKEIESWSN